MPRKISRGITITEELNGKLRYERPDINVSKVCEQALWKALEKEPVFDGNKLVRDKNSK